jgi:hypothetical protein
MSSKRFKEKFVFEQVVPVVAIPTLIDQQALGNGVGKLKF